MSHKTSGADKSDAAESHFYNESAMWLWFGASGNPLAQGRRFNHNFRCLLLLPCVPRHPLGAFLFCVGLVRL